MADLALVGDTAPTTLDDFARIANDEHGQAQLHVASALAHAARAGNALNAAREKVPHGMWMAWVAENCDFHVSTVNLYRRIARESGWLADHGATSINGAERLLQSLQVGPRGFSAVTRPQEIVDKAREMRANGSLLREIAEECAISVGTASMWTSKDSYVDRADRAARLRKLVERDERDRAMRVAGGAAYEGYSLLRKAAQTLQVASEREQNRDARIALADALAQVYKAEDAMVRAVKTTSEKRQGA